MSKTPARLSLDALVASLSPQEPHVGWEWRDVLALDLPPATLAVILDAEPRDKYGRLLAYVLVDGRRFDDELLARGYARFLVIPPNGSHARAMLQAELASRAAGRGLWGAC